MDINCYEIVLTDVAKEDLDDIIWIHFEKIKGKSNSKQVNEKNWASYFKIRTNTIFICKDTYKTA